MMVKVGEQGTITIPDALRDQLPEGALLDLVLREDGVLELRPQRSEDDSQAWFWTERWQQMERETDADVAAGRLETFDDVDAFLADLDARGVDVNALTVRSHRRE